MKNLVGKLNNPLYLISGGVVVLVIIIVVGFVIFGGGGDDDETRTPGADPTLGFGEGDPSALPGRRRNPPKQAPVVRTGVLDEARREGRLAVAQARGTIVEPTRVRIRISAAPKQPVTVNYQLGCFRDRRAKVGRGSYRTTPPDTREVPIPMAAPKSCIVTAGAQLTRNEGEGRVKVAVISG